MADQISIRDALGTTVPEQSSITGHPRNQLDVEEPGASENAVSYPEGAQIWIVTGSVLITVFLLGLDLTIVAPAIPSLTNEFKTISDIGWYSSAYGFVLATFGFFFGKLYSVYSVKHVYIASLVFFELGSLLCTVAPSSKAFIVGRALAGLGSAGLGLGGFTIITHCFPMQKRPIWTGLAGAAQSVGLITAPVIGGALIDALSWRACFGINLPLGVVTVVLIAYFFKSPMPSADIDLPWMEKIKRLDLLSTATLVPAIACLLLALQLGGSKHSWSDAPIIVLLAVSVALLILFGWLQYRFQEKAVLPPRILKHRSILAAAWFSLCCNAALAVTEYYIAIYFQGVKGYTATKSGLLGLPMIIGLLISGVVSGFGTSIVGYYAPFMITTTVVAPVAAGVLTTLNIDENLVKVLLCLGVLGFAIGLGINQPYNAVQTVLPTREISIGIAILGFGGGLGSSLFLAVSAALFQSRLIDEVHKFSPSTNATEIGKVGLSDIRNVIGGDRLRDVLLGYDTAVTQTLYLPVALMVLSIIGSASVEWRSVKKKES